MPPVLTNHGGDALFKGGFFTGGVTASLHTAAPPSDANKVAASWYSDQGITEAQFSLTTESGRRLARNNVRVVYGTTPSSNPGTAPTYLALKRGSNYLWYDDIVIADWGADKRIETAINGITIGAALQFTEL